MPAQRPNHRQTAHIASCDRMFISVVFHCLRHWLPGTWPSSNVLKRPKVVFGFSRWCSVSTNVVSRTGRWRRMQATSATQDWRPRDFPDNAGPRKIFHPTISCLSRAGRQTCLAMFVSFRSFKRRRVISCFALVVVGTSCGPTVCVIIS